MNLERAPEILHKLVAQAPDTGDGEIVEALVREGLSANDAEATLAFVPMACGHAVLAAHGARFPETFIARDLDRNRERRGRLKDQPMFLAAGAFIANRGVDATEVQLLAARSAELHAARQLQWAGGDASGLRFTETVLLRLPVEAVARRPWWRLSRPPNMR